MLERMAIRDALLPEYDHEIATTRKLLERVPDADLGWRPHPKSFTLGELAAHIANLPFWCLTTVQTTQLDLDTLGDAARIPAPGSTAEMLAGFDKIVGDARHALAGCGDSEMMSPWTLKKGGQEIFTLPKIGALRSFVMNHLIHHRGQLSVYLRLRDIPLPPIYGPSADEQ
jgi:uncharacterized damage-inducible protein DinB